MNYIIHDDDLYLSESNYYAELGSFVHEILANILSGELPVEQSADYFIDHYDDHICYRARESTMQNAKYAIIEYLADLNTAQIADYEILGVELREDFSVASHRFVGFIDLLLRDKRDGKIVVVDHKSTEYPFRRDGKVKKKLVDSFEQYKKQMYLYAHAVYKRYGEFPKEMSWNHFKDGGKIATIPFRQEEYDDVMRWFTEAIAQIQSEQEFEPHQEYFYCHNLCNFRHSCEYCTSELDG